MSRNRFRWTPALLAAALTVIATAPPAVADIMLGSMPPDFTKKRLVGASEGPEEALYATYGGKIVILYLFGYNCPVCVQQAPSFETQIQQYYLQSAPDLVQVIGVDSWNGSPAAVANFRNVTGATYPLYLYGGTATGGNLDVLYGPWDNFLVLDLRDQTVRYHSALIHAHGNRYVAAEIRSAVDELLIVGADAPRNRLSLSAQPNPSRGPLRVSFGVPAEHTGSVRLTLHEANGRRVATLHEGAVEAGGRQLRWSAPPEWAPGVYWLRLAAGGDTLHRRIVLFP